MSTGPIIVAGLGRCGMTAMMTALHAGGIRCAGEPPAFEPRELMPPVRPAWLAAQHDVAVKLLDPHRSRGALRGPHGPVIFMTRDHREQARSQLKLLRLTMGRIIPDDAVSLAPLLRGISNDEGLSIWTVSPIALRVSFEDLVAAPAAVMAKVAAVLPARLGFNADAAAAVIQRRDPKCAPGLDMELAAVARHDAAKAGRP